MPNATFQQALPLLAKRVNSLDKKDFVIFIAGTNNINLKTIPEFDLSPLVNLQKQTNVFVSEIPYRHNNSDSYDVNEIIYQVNLNLYNRLYHTDVKMIKLTTFEYSLFTKHGIHLNNGGKNQLVIAIKQLILKTSEDSCKSKNFLL